MDIFFAIIGSKLSISLLNSKTFPPKKIFWLGRISFQNMTDIRETSDFGCNQATVHFLRKSSDIYPFFMFEFEMAMRLKMCCF